MDNLDFLDGSPEPQDVAPVQEAQDAPAEVDTAPEQPQEVAEGPVRDEQGRFAPKQTMVPLSALEQERARRQAAEDRARQYESQREIPDVFTDPEAFALHQQQQAQSIALNVKLDLSEDMARGKHGDEAVDAARDWALARFAQSPAFQQEVLGHRNPYEHVVSLYKREQLLANVTPDDLEQFQAWKAAKANALQPAQAAPQPVPPRSIATVPNAGGAKPGAEPVYEGAAFDAIFRK